MVPGFPAPGPRASENLNVVMKEITKCLSLAGALLVCLPLAAQNPTPELEQLKEELRQLRDQAARLEQRINQYEQARGGMAGQDRQVPAPTTNAPPQSEAAGLLSRTWSPTAATNPPPAAPAAPEGGLLTRSWSPSQPIPLVQAGRAYMNLSFDALLDLGTTTERDPSAWLELGDHDPLQRGFSLRNAELVLDGAVDPYFKGAANLVFKLDRDNETEVELEETYVQTTSLPGNFQAKAGQFFANFGRQNSQHPHQWAFVDDPIILARLLGPEGLRNVGVQASWLAPTPFYSEAFLGIFNSGGGTAYQFRNLGQPDAAGVQRVHGRATVDRGLDNPGDLLFVPRLATAFDLTDRQTLLFGASGAFGPNDFGADTATQIYGVDAYWKWTSPRAHQGFPFVSMQAEGLYGRYGVDADPLAFLPAERLEDWGFYAQGLWGIKPRWVLGLRGEYADGNAGAADWMDPFRGERERISPNLTWYPSEFSKLRLQYNFDHGKSFGEAHSVWLQMEFLLGAHAAHKF